MNVTRTRPARALNVTCVVHAKGLPDARVALQARSGFTVQLATAHTGPMGPPGVFTAADFVTQPEADADFKTA